MPGPKTRLATSPMFRHMITPGRWWPLLLIAFAGKLLLFVLYLVEHGTSLNGPWYRFGGDTSGYIDPVESIFGGGGYQPDMRMPGYGLPYFLVRSLMAPHPALQTMVVLQVLASAISVILLARTALALTGSVRAFRSTYWIALMATFTSVFDGCILTESFSAFALIGSVHAVVAYLEDHRRSHIYAAGLMMAWLIFMKPVYLPVLAILSVPLWFRRSVPCAQRARTIVLFAAPFLIAESAWIVRNANVHGVFRPFSDGIISPSIRANVKYPMLRLMQTYGASFIWWDNTAEIRWFGVRTIGEGPGATPVGPPPLPGYAYTSACPLDTLELIADGVEVYYRDSTDAVKRSVALANVTQRCDRCIAAFKTERPFYYHVVSKLRLLKKFILTSGTSTLLSKPWGELHPVGKAIKLLYSLLYLGVIVPGFAWGLVVLFRRRGSPAARTFAAVFIYGVTIFPLVMRMEENRYLTTPYPFAIVLSVMLGIGLADRWSGHRRSSKMVSSSGTDTTTGGEL